MLLAFERPGTIRVLPFSLKMGESRVHLLVPLKQLTCVAEAGRQLRKEREDLADELGQLGR